MHDAEGVVVWRCLGIVILAVVTSSCSAPRNVLSRNQVAAIDAIALRDMHAQHIPGMAIGVASDGKIVYARGFGISDVGESTDANTIFPVGSITKQFTAACVMLLVQDRRVRLEDPIGRYLRNVPHGKEVTVRELLDQTSGFGDYSQVPGMQKMLGPVRLATVTPAQLLSLIADKPLQFRPGTKFTYSNTNYLLAGMIVAAAGGASYPTFLRKRIFDLLKLKRTQYLRTSVPAGPDVATGYAYQRGKFVQLPGFTMSWARGAGALASNVSDLAAWDDAFFHGRVVNARTLPTMITPPRVRGEADYAFGWVVETVRGRRMIWHNGAFPGAHAMNAVFPQSGWEIVVLTNIWDAEPEEIAKQISAVLMAPRRP